jgi:WhiB family transcriptional regulator, redox-sensing transcriptional regulator
VSSWWERAACREVDPEWFFPLPLDHETREAALSVCDTCPVTRQCTELAEIHQTSAGIFGGRDWGVEPWRPQRAEAVA